MDGVKHVLGIWVQGNEGAKFWASVCAELANRGVKDVLIVCCDGLTGFPEAIEATWPAATVQTCVVHLIRAAMRFVNYTDRKRVAAALKPIYQAANQDAALTELDAFEASELGRKYPSTVESFRDAWERFTPFLAFPPALRKVIYTTDVIVNPLTLDCWAASERSSLGRHVRRVRPVHARVSGDPCCCSRRRRPAWRPGMAGRR